MSRALAASMAMTIVLGAAAGLAMDVPTVTSPPEAPTRRTITVEEAWRAGADPDEEFLFGVIGDAVRTDDGRIVVLDHQAQTAHVFAADGRYLGEVAGEGEGPGELSLVYGVELWAPDQLAFMRVFPAELIIVGGDGIPIRNLKLTAAESPGESAFLTLSGFAHRDGHLVCMAGRSWFDAGKRSGTDLLAVFAEDSGRQGHPFGEQASGYDFSRTITVDEEKDFFPLHRWALGPAGDVYLAPERDAYLVEVRGTDGALRRRITRDVAPHRRTQAEKDAVKNGYTFSSDGGEVPDVQYRISDISPPIASLAWRDDTLWVELPHGDAEDGLAERLFAVHAGDGRLLEERRYLVPLDEDQDRLMFLGSGWVLRLANLRAAQDGRAAGLSVKRGETFVGTDVDDVGPLEAILYRTLE